MALDEPQENDFTYTDRGVTLAIAKDLLEQVKPIRVDYVESEDGSGFQLSSSLAKSDGCGSSCKC
jgi:iron-sulfur cluster assembly protein